MKKIVLFLSCLVTLLSVQSGFSETLPKLFTCKYFSISYPTGWTVSTEGNINDISSYRLHLKTGSDAGSNIIIAMVPSVNDYSPDVLDTYEKSLIDKFSPQFIVRPRVTDFKYGMTMHTVYTMQNVNGTKCRVIQFFINKGQLTYIVTGTIKESLYSQEIDTVMKVIDSFEAE